MLDEVELGEIGREYSRATEEDGIEYGVEQFIYWCPELDMSFREGIATDLENEEDFEFVAIYNGLDYNSENVQDIYSNCTLGGIISMIASQKGINADHMKCVLEIPD